MSRIQKIIESIKETQNFKIAFTHSSFQNEQKLNYSYEILEFLGDSIINFQVSLFIYNKFSNFSEGEMSKLKQLMVKESTLADISRKICLSRFLKLGEGEKNNGGFGKNSIISDIFESFVGALYIEKGEKITNEFLDLTLFNWLKGKEGIIWDYKTKLQEYCQSEKNLIFYNVIIIKNFDNKKNFTVELIDTFGKICERGSGKSKKKAEQQAAFKAMKKLKII